MISITLKSETAEALAEFIEALELPAPDGSLYDDAAEAVRREYQQSVRWKKLNCLSVETITYPSGDSLFVLSVGQTPDFDWTWEGAVAFRPVSVPSFLADPMFTERHLDDAEVMTAVWAGEVVEVDETRGRLFLKVNDPTNPPRKGIFFVRPFEFLAALNTAFEKPPADDTRRVPELAKRLHAASGGVHPLLYPDAPSSEQAFASIWAHSWSVLWGPPGAGKTSKIGGQVAGLVADSDERVLIVSTTNRATDEVALSIGSRAKRLCAEDLAEGNIIRVGKGSDYSRFSERSLLDMLQGTEADLLKKRGELLVQLRKLQSPEERAFIRVRLNQLTRAIKEAAFRNFTSPAVRVVVATSFKALSLLNSVALRRMIAQGTAPFTTVILDEAGLLSRAATAALSLLASRRVVLAGDPKQLAPISRVSRVVPPLQARWLESSALSHLLTTTRLQPGVNLLRVQHRMHPEIRRVISEYQYEGAVMDGPNVASRPDTSPAVFFGTPKAIWYVLDEDAAEAHHVRAERGPGNKSWVRPITDSVITRLLGCTDMRSRSALFVTPFRAQARSISEFLVRENVQSWSAGTVHAQQGTEADLVIFDTVNAGSCAWPYDEWKRLVNVGLSRARHELILIASRAEMGEPYMQALRKSFWPAVLKRSGDEHVWVEVKSPQPMAIEAEAEADETLLGAQIRMRKRLRPIMSIEQERLCALSLDGKPRLVRGVAGSGKTLVLAHWLRKTVDASKNKPDYRIWAVYANRSLHKLIESSIIQAGSDGRELPWDRIRLLHAKDVLQMLLPRANMKFAHDEFKYDDLAAEFLSRYPLEKLEPCCDAMFIDEAQDMGPNMLQLLAALVKQSEPGNPKARAINIFYDNAQNVYRRGAPKWTELGLDMRGRSTVMKESFRSTRPILEYALNVLYALQPPDDDPEHREMVERELIELGERSGKPWWNVRYNQVDGPAPSLRQFVSFDKEMDALREQVLAWLTKDQVQPNDICIIFQGQHIRKCLESTLMPALREAGLDLAFMKEHGRDANPNAVIASTPHSFKGYEAEVVAVVAAEQLCSLATGIYAETIYVAMTRARSILTLFTSTDFGNHPGKAKLLATLTDCLETLRSRTAVETNTSALDQFEDLLAFIGNEYRDWLTDVFGKHQIQLGAIINHTGEILAEPLFWFYSDTHQYAVYGRNEPSAHTLEYLNEHGIKLVRPGNISSVADVPDVP